MTRPRGSVITAPWLRWFSAELMKTLRRNSERWARRNAEITETATAPRKEATTMPLIKASQIMLGSSEPTLLAGSNPPEAASACACDKALTARHTRAVAREILLPACHFFPAIGHLRISAPECLRLRVWIG